MFKLGCIPTKALLKALMSMTILTMLMNMALKFQVIKLILVLLLKEAEMLQKR